MMDLQSLLQGCFRMKDLFGLPHSSSPRLLLAGECSSNPWDSSNSYVRPSRPLATETVLPKWWRSWRQAIWNLDVAKFQSGSGRANVQGDRSSGITLNWWAASRASLGHGCADKTNGAISCSQSSGMWPPLRGIFVERTVQGVRRTSPPVAVLGEYPSRSAPQDLLLTPPHTHTHIRQAEGKGDSSLTCSCPRVEKKWRNRGSCRSCWTGL